MNLTNQKNKMINVKLNIMEAYYGFRCTNILEDGRICNKLLAKCNSSGRISGQFKCVRCDTNYDIYNDV